MRPPMLKQSKTATYVKCLSSLQQTVFITTGLAQAPQLGTRHCCTMWANIRLLASRLSVARLIAPLTEGEQPTNSETTTMDVVPASPACAHMALAISVRLIAGGGTLHSFKDSTLHQQLKNMDSLTAK